MSAEIQTPNCEITGLPLLIYPSRSGNDNAFLPTNFHHPQHPNRDPELQGLEGRALRYSAGQDVSKTLHDNYHRLFLGPELPSTTDRKFRSAVLHCAGVVPRQALDVSRRDTFKIVDLTDNELMWLSDPFRHHTESANHEKRSRRINREIGKFFADYALKQDIQQVISESVISEFIDVKTRLSRKKELGNFIMTHALNLSIEPIRPVIKTLKEEGNLPQVRLKSLTGVLRRFVKKQYLADYHGEITERLMAIV